MNMNMNTDYPWPMSVLTSTKNNVTKLICRPQEIVKRSDIEIIDGVIRLKKDAKIKIPFDTKYSVENKYQGHRYLYYRDKNGQYGMFSRNTNVNGTYTQMMRKLGSITSKLYTLPVNTVIDGELICRGKPDSYVATAIANGENLEFKAFGVPIYNGESIHAYKKGVQILNSLRYTVQRQEIWLTKDNAKLTIESLLNEAKKKGIEGYVLKHEAWDQWYKIKVIDTLDVFIEDFIPSKKETRLGKITSLKIAAYTNSGDLYPLGNVSGIPFDIQDELTLEYKKHGNSYDNKFKLQGCEVIFQERAANGKLKHGSFVKWHGDKLPCDCTLPEGWDG